MIEEFKYLGTTLTNENSVQEEIKSRFMSGNACFLLSRLIPYAKEIIRDHECVF
jgi:hypothetical protein